MGALLFGGDPLQPQRPAVEEVQNADLEPEPSELKGMLQSQMSFPAALPWLLPKAVDAAPIVQKDVPQWPSADLSALAAKQASVELHQHLRVELQQLRTESSQRLHTEMHQLREESRHQKDATDERLTQLERAGDQSRRADAATHEQFASLQAELYNLELFGRQRAKTEGEANQALARQQASLEGRLETVQQRNEQLHEDVVRLHASLEELNLQQIAARSELRTRMAALEAADITRRSAAPPSHADFAGGGAGIIQAPAVQMQAYEQLRHMLSEVRQLGGQTSADLAELQARLQHEESQRWALQRDHEGRLAALTQATRAEREDLHYSWLQRLEVLEARMGVERGDLMARQAELRDEFASGDQAGSVRLQDLEIKFRGGLEALERRLHDENISLRDHVEQYIAQVQSARATEEEARRASQANLMKRIEGTAERQLEANRGLSHEVEAGFKELRSALVAESQARNDIERRVQERVAESVHVAAAGEAAALRVVLQKQMEMLTAELNQMRHANTERADRLSRYVDSVVARAGDAPVSERSGAIGSEVTSRLSELAHRIASLQNSTEERAGAVERRIEATAEELRLKLRRAEESRQLAANSLRQDAERAAVVVERRAVAAQEELKGRFEVYVQHFDGAIASVQAAILCPPLRGSLDEKPQEEKKEAAGNKALDEATRKVPALLASSEPVSSDTAQVRQDITEQVMAACFNVATSHSLEVPAAATPTASESMEVSPREVFSPGASVATKLP